MPERDSTRCAVPQILKVRKRSEKEALKATEKEKAAEGGGDGVVDEEEKLMEEMEELQARTGALHRTRCSAASADVSAQLRSHWIEGGVDMLLARWLAVPRRARRV